MRSFLCYISLRAFGVAVLLGNSLLGAATSRSIHLPLTFEANHGQTDARVRFFARAGNQNVFLTPDEVVFASRGAVIRTRLIGHAARPTLEGGGRLPAALFYFKDGQSIATEGYASVAYKNIYQGSDLIFYGNDRQVEYDFDIHPGASPGNIAWAIDGAERLSLDRDGNLVITTKAGALTQHAPMAYQVIDGHRRDVNAGFQLTAGNQVRFHVGEYDRSHDLILDPTLEYSTYLGGTGGTDQIWDLKVDSTGAVYVAGSTSSPNFPAVNSPEPFTPNGDAFVAKLSPDGQSLVYSDFFGGSTNGVDSANALTLDSARNVYFTGFTNKDFGSQYAFLGKVAANGSPVFFNDHLTHASGGGTEAGSSVAIDPQGNIAVGGTAQFATLDFINGFGGNGGSTRGFVLLVDPGGSNTLYATYVGTGMTYVNAIAVDSAGMIYATGHTEDVQISSNAFQTQTSGSGIFTDDAYVVKINPHVTGAASFVYGTYIGGAEWDSGNSILVDGSGNAWITGETRSNAQISGVPYPTTPTAFQHDLHIDNYGDTHCNATIDVEFCSDIVVTGVNADGSALLYSSYFGGSGNDVGRSLAIDAQGLLYVGGSSCGFPNYPITSDALQTKAGSCGTGAILIVDPSKSGQASLVYSSYFGGSANEEIEGIDLDGKGNLYVAGWTHSLDFPTLNPLPNQSKGGGDAPSGFIASFALGSSGGSSSVSISLNANVPGASFQVSGTGCAAGTYSAPAALSWNGGSACSVTAIAPTGYSFSGWRGGPSSPSLNITAPAAPATYTAQFSAGTQQCSFSLAASTAGLPATASNGSVNVAATSGCAWTTVNNNPDWLLVDSATSGNGNGTVTFQAAANTSTNPRTGSLTIAGQTFAIVQAGTAPVQSSALRFVPVTPCRVVDTRNADGPLGGPILSANTSRDFPIPSSGCGIPAGAKAYSINVTAVPDAQLGYLTLWPTGQPQPYISTLNSDGRTKAVAAIVPAGVSGSVSVFVTDESHVVLDINGYFIDKGASGSALAYYPVAPCRVFDTRGAVGPLGGPSLAGNSSRDLPVLTSTCNLPTNAQAYVFNITAVPHGPLWFVTTWPTGQNKPWVSTLNAPTGTVVANSAIIPAGTNGDMSVFATNDTDLVGDVTGYFAPPSNSGLSLYNLQPCRVLDTRSNGGTPFQNVLAVPVSSYSCNAPASAQSFVLNATVVPSQILGYLTLWPDAQPQPYVSALNAEDGAITSNMAITPASNGAVDAYASNPTHLILDISGYFAP